MFNGFKGSVVQGQRVRAVQRQHRVFKNGLILEIVHFPPGPVFIETLEQITAGRLVRLDEGGADPQLRCPPGARMRERSREEAPRNL